MTNTVKRNRGIIIALIATALALMLLTTCTFHGAITHDDGSHASVCNIATAFVGYTVTGASNLLLFGFGLVLIALLLAGNVDRGKLRDPNSRPAGLIFYGVFSVRGRVGSGIYNRAIISPLA